MLFSTFVPSRVKPISTMTFLYDFGLPAHNYFMESQSWYGIYFSVCTIFEQSTRCPFVKFTFSTNSLIVYSRRYAENNTIHEYHIFCMVLITFYLFQRVIEAWWGWLGAAYVAPAFSEPCRIMRVGINGYIRMIDHVHLDFFQGRSGLPSRRTGVIWRHNTDISKATIFIHFVWTISVIHVYNIYMIKMQ